MKIVYLMGAALCAALAVFYFAIFVLARFSGADVARFGRASGWELLMNTWATRLTPWVPPRTEKKLARQIVMAGGLAGLTPARVLLNGALATVLGLAVGAWVVVFSHWRPWLVLATTGVGALMPFIWLRDQVKRRHRDILADLPYHLDLLTLCVEAGLDFSAGVARAVQRGRMGPLREELNAYLGELRMGKSRGDALLAMSERVGLMELSTFLSALIQADRLGAGMGRTLRLQAEQLRLERFVRAEKAAGEAPVKMLLPLVMFIFPTIWIILAAPLVFQWMYPAGP